MLMLLLVLLLTYICFLPVTLQADVHHHAATQAQIKARLMGIEKTWLIRGLSGAATQLRQRRSRMLLELLLRTDKARGFLLQHIRLDRLDALVLLRTEDAARSALLTGALRSVLICIPAVRRGRVRIQVLPEFFRAHSTVNARCIIRIRLGTIILTAMMLLIAHIREQRQQKARHAYGTSHW